MTQSPNLAGHTALVTGANSGLGLQVATVLASGGARVLLAARNVERGTAALATVSAAAAGAAPELLTLDLASLESVKAAVAEVERMSPNGLDLLVNNGGIMAPPLAFSVDGFELQWATNVLGPAALTWQLLPQLDHQGGRVVWVSSTRHASARVAEEQIRRDIRGENYRGFDVYGRTKLADLLLSRQLAAHFESTGNGAISAAAHPGFTATAIVENGFAGLPAALRPIANWGARTLGQPVAAGALPILFAATAPGVHGDDYFGPRSLGGLRGKPADSKRSVQSRDDSTMHMLTRLVSEFTGIPAPGESFS